MRGRTQRNPENAQEPHRERGPKRESQKRKAELAHEHQGNAKSSKSQEKKKWKSTIKEEKREKRKAWGRPDAATGGKTEKPPRNDQGRPRSFGLRVFDTINKRRKKRKS